MFIKLKIKYKGETIELGLHEVVYLASQAVGSVQEKEIALTKQANLLDNADLAENEEEKFIREVAEHIVPFSIGPLSNPAEWLGVARGITSLKDQEQLAININEKIIAIRLADLYSSDYGLIPSIARELYETTFMEPWHEHIYAKMHEYVYAELSKAYVTSNLEKIKKELRESFERDFDKDMQELGIGVEEASVLHRQIEETDFLTDFVPRFLQKKHSIAANRQFYQQNTADKAKAAKLAVLKSKMAAINRGSLDLLPRASDAYLIPLSHFDPSKKDFETAQEKIKKGPSYQNFEQSLTDDQHYFSDVTIAELLRQMLLGQKVDSYPSYLPNVLVAWFICETSRNNLSMLTSLILLDFMQAQIRGFFQGHNLYEFRYILRNPLVGVRGATIVDVYGKKLGPDEWGGMHPMASDGSYVASQATVPRKNKKDGHYVTDPLTIVRQKEGSLILHWLFCILQKEYPEIELVQLAKGETLPKQFNYDEVVIDIDNSANPNLPLGLKIDKTNSVSLNKKIRDLKDKINEFKRAHDNKIDKEQADTFLKQLLPLKIKQDLIQGEILPLLKQRLTNFDFFSYLSPNPINPNMISYGEVIIYRILQMVLKDLVIIISQAQLAYDRFLQDNIRQAMFQAIISDRDIVLPIQLDNNHWAAMVIKKHAADTPSQIIYNDSLGNSLESELRAAIIAAIVKAIDPNSEIIDLQFSQQTNSCDSGPLIVDNIIKLTQHPTQGLNKQELSALLFQPLSCSTSLLRCNQHIALLPMTDEEFLQLCSEGKHEIDALQKLPPQSYQNYNVIQKLWQTLPDINFVNEILRRLNILEISLKSNKQFVQTKAKKFIESFLKAYITAYQRDEKNQGSIIQLLKRQLTVLNGDQPFQFVDDQIKYFILEFIIKSLLNENSAYKEKVKASHENELVNIILLELRGSAVLEKHQAKLATTACSLTLPWIKDVLNFIKSSPSGHEQLLKFYEVYAGLEIIKKYINETRGLREIFVDILKSYNEWLEKIDMNKKHFTAIFSLLIEYLDKFDMQNTLFYSACRNQIRSLKSAKPMWFGIPYDFLIDIKIFQLQYLLKSELASATEQDEHTNTQPKISPSVTRVVVTSRQTLVTQLNITAEILAILQLETMPILNHLIPDKLQHQDRALKRAQDYQYALEHRQVHDTYPSLGNSWKHHETVADGNCALSAIALGLLYHKNDGNDRLTIHNDFRRQFAQSFNINPDTFTTQAFSQTIDTLLSSSINTDNPIIRQIITKLKQIENPAPGTATDQINMKITAACNRAIMPETFEGGDIKAEYFDDAVRVLARQGILYQLVMAYVLRRYCAPHNGEKFTCFTNQLCKQGEEIEYVLNASNKFGEYLDDTVIAFLAVTFGLTIRTKSSEFGRITSYGTSNLSMIIFNLRPGKVDCHFELVLPAHAKLLENRLQMSNIIIDRQRKAEKPSYPLSLTIFGVRENKATGPKIAKAVVEIAKKTVTAHTHMPLRAKWV